jgi:GTP pyrophosphokinase
VEWQRDVQDAGEFMSNLKVDLYPEEVYTFTPRGKVIVLPRDATAIDFAYAIHSDVGQACVGAKVNGRIVPLRYTLKNGDIVEILTQPGHQPSKDWLAVVKTTRARNKIKHVINANERAKAIEIGQKYLEKEARRLGVQLSKVQRSDLEKAAADYGVSKIEDLYAALGYGKFSARQALQKMAPQQIKEEQMELPKAVPEPVPGGATPLTRTDGDAVIKVKGVDDLLVYRAKCCNPIRGEAIVGYVTRGKGIAVHSKMCPNVQNLLYDVERKIEVEWARNTADSFPVRIVVHTDDRPGLLAQITSVVSAENTNIRSLEARAEGNAADGALVEMTVDIRDKKQLEKLVAAMRRISGIRDVERLLN